MIKLIKGFLVALTLGFLAACHTTGVSSPSGNGFPVTTSAAPTSVKLYEPAREVLACIRKSGALKTVIFNVNAFNDSTGKINAVSPGATGAFMPGQGSAVFIVDALQEAGASMVASNYLGTPLKKVNGFYTVQGFYNSLDFSTPLNADLRFAGIGPIGTYGVAMLSMSIQLLQTEYLANRQISTIERLVKYSSAGVGVGNAFGPTLVTGQLSVNNQERLQFEALNGPIALGVADAIIKEFQVARERCGTMIANILRKDEILTQAEGGI